MDRLDGLLKGPAHQAIVPFWKACRYSVPLHRSLFRPQLLQCRYQRSSTRLNQEFCVPDVGTQVLLAEQRFYRICPAGAEDISPGQARSASAARG